MIAKRYRRILIGAIGSLFLMGFSGQEKFVELEGFLNGRSSAQFRAIDTNVKTVLTTGTRGEILESKKMLSGNYGLRIRPISGDKQGQEFWVYYNVNHPDLKLFEDAPSEWGPDANLRNPPTNAVDKAKGAETVRETPAIEAPATATPAETPAADDGTAGADGGAKAYAPIVLSKIAKANDQVKRAGIPPSAAQVECEACKPKKETVERPAPKTNAPAAKIARATRAMAPMCSQIMDTNGRAGAWGQSILSIMSEPKYIMAFTDDNALGSLCPKFNTLSPTQRLQAWTWFWAALGQEESSCNLTQRHGTTTRDRHGRVRVLNPREGYGLWAMEKDRNIRRDRGSACNDISTAAGQARCSIDIMYTTQLKRHKTAVSSGSYWGPIRRKDSQLMPHMRRFGLCFQ